MGLKINVTMIVDYLLEHSMTRAQFCDKCGIYLEDLEMILEYGHTSLLIILLISRATGLDKDALKFSEPYTIH